MPVDRPLIFYHIDGVFLAKHFFSLGGDFAENTARKKDHYLLDENFLVVH
jgi:hypothetical protein